jgi:hypothetical protein
MAPSEPTSGPGPRQNDVGRRAGCWRGRAAGSERDRAAPVLGRLPAAVLAGCEGGLERA